MSRNIIRIINTLAKNDGLVRLLINNQGDPLSHEVTDHIKKNITKPSSEDARIFPYPYDEEATVEESSFIRVYYNDGTFNASETIADCDLHIDIIVARNLWLIHDNAKNESLIRPYEIMDRVVDTLGRRGMGQVKVDISGFQHHYVNTKFDCIRLYCTYTSIETMKQKDR